MTVWSWNRTYKPAALPGESQWPIQWIADRITCQYKRRQICTSLNKVSNIGKKEMEDKLKSNFFYVPPVLSNRWRHSQSVEEGAPVTWDQNIFSWPCLYDRPHEAHHVNSPSLPANMERLMTQDSPCLCPTSKRMGSSRTIMNVLFFSYSSSSIIFTVSSFLEREQGNEWVKQSIYEF